ncbi:MAG: efflux RND transporter periplasmic adaptor subunit [Alphaproteobacteria bacterium]|nr:efflux RND transporter periplasmic adaptor subunit [Alphaproteobacteria bacterium]
MKLNFQNNIIPFKLMTFLRQRIISLIALVVLLMIFSVVYVLKGGGKNKSHGAGGFSIPIEASKIQMRDVEDSVVTIGTLNANESIIIRPEVIGRIKQILFKEGEPVEKGRALILLEDEVAHAELEDAKANFMLAKSNHQRIKKLYSKNFNSGASYDEAQADLMKAQAQVAIKQAILKKTKIEAPFEGIIGLRTASPGDYVQPGQDLVNLEDISPIKIDFTLPEVYATQIKNGQSIEFTTDTLAGQTYKGTVYAINPKLDKDGRSVCIRARASNDQNLLRPGMFVKVNVILKKRLNSLLVAEEAIVPIGNDQFVYLVKDNKVQFTKVELGLRKDGKVEILKGLKAGDVVVTAGQLKLQDGAPVTIQVESK